MPLDLSGVDHNFSFIIFLNSNALDALYAQVLHYLETLQPHHLLEQMVCSAFKVSADTLNQTSFGNLQLMKTKLNQLYITLASSLRPLRGMWNRP